MYLNNNWSNIISFKNKTKVFGHLKFFQIMKYHIRLIENSQKALIKNLISIHPYQKNSSICTSRIKITLKN